MTIKKLLPLCLLSCGLLTPAPANCWPSFYKFLGNSISHFVRSKTGKFITLSAATTGCISLMAYCLSSKQIPSLIHTYMAKFNQKNKQPAEASILRQENKRPAVAYQKASTIITKQEREKARLEEITKHVSEDLEKAHAEIQRLKAQLAAMLKDSPKQPESERIQTLRTELEKIKAEQTEDEKYFTQTCRDAEKRLQDVQQRNKAEQSELLARLGQLEELLRTSEATNKQLQEQLEELRDKQTYAAT